MNICICEDCEIECEDATDDGDSLCVDCAQNRAERGWERFCEDFYGGADPFTIRERQIAAWKAKP